MLRGTLQTRVAAPPTSAAPPAPPPVAAAISTSASSCAACGAVEHGVKVKVPLRRRRRVVDW